MTQDDDNTTKDSIELSKEKKENSVTSTAGCIKIFENYNFISLVVIIVSIVTLFTIAANDCRICFAKLQEKEELPSANYATSKTLWVYGRNVESGYLHNVLTILNSFGFNTFSTSDWDLLWAHDYPFRTLYSQLKDLEPHQKVNHFPGCGYLTNKVDLAISGLKYIPPAFRLPDHKERLIKYANEHPGKPFVEKNNDHRNIRVKKLEDINLDSNSTFIQEFVDKPLLVNGHKFDVGIYVIITSVDPLRIYIYDGDALLRFCPVKYYPFDPNNLDKYVVGDDYLPIWEVPSLGKYYNQLGFGMREILNEFLRQQGRNPKIIWEQIEDSIRLTILAKEQLIVDVVNRFKTKRNFFEMMRFDFVIDEDLNVYLLEANMSPNLSSAHFPPNQLMYQQVLYNVLALVGVGERIHKDTLAYRSKDEQEMVVADKNIAVYPKECSSTLCETSCVSPKCQLCKPCLSPDTKEYLLEAYREHLNKGDCKRIFPIPVIQELADAVNFDEYSPENQLQYRWFIGKCLLDKSWC